MRGKKPMDLSGQRFGRLVVGERIATGVGQKTRWSCRCDCGRVVECGTATLRRGDTQSCGCLRSETTTAKNVATAKHGECTAPEYMAWAYMQKRCFNPAFEGFKYYGGRGITVTPEWLGEGGYERFLAHVGRKPSAIHSLDRIKTEGHYEPGNVRWATPTEQARNRRPMQPRGTKYPIPRPMAEESADG